MRVIRDTHYSRSHFPADPASWKLSASISQHRHRILRRNLASVASMSSSKEAVTEVLMKYEAALNESSTDKVMELYAPDGVFMPQHNPSAVGTDDVRKAYAGVFEALTLAVKFKVRKSVTKRDNTAIALCCAFDLIDAASVTPMRLSCSIGCVRPASTCLGSAKTFVSRVARIH